MSNQKTKTINKLSFGNYGTCSWLWHSEFDLCPECGNALTAWVNVRKSLSLSKDDEELTDDGVDDYDDYEEMVDDAEWTNG